MCTVICLTSCSQIAFDPNLEIETTLYHDKTALTPLVEENIEWVTMTGGLGDVSTKVLFPGHDDVKIHKIISMINENEDMVETEIAIIDTVFSRLRPIGLLISFKDDKRPLYLWPSYEIVTLYDGWTVSTRTDRFVMQIEENGASGFYTVFCSAMAEYLVEGWKEDMPVVDGIKIESETASGDNNHFVLGDGDSITLSGDGCPYPSVEIYLRKNAENHRYYLGSAETLLGAWKWNGKIDRVLETVDGESIQLEDGLYDILIQFGDTEKTVFGIIKMGKM